MLSGLADIADLLAALGVIISLVLVVLELRRNTRALKQGNWESWIDRQHRLGSDACEPHLSDVIARGRQSYFALSPAERIAFGNFHIAVCQNFEAVVRAGEDQLHADPTLPRLALRYHLGYPGAREWLAEFRRELWMPRALTAFLDEVLADCEPRSEPGPL